MTSIYIIKLSFVTQKTDVGSQKIDGLSLITNKIVLVGFLVKDKLKKVRFFKKTFLLADISIKVVLGMLFLIFQNTDI